MRVFSLLIFFLGSLWGEEDPLLKGPGLSIELISENTSISAGEPFTLGIDIKHFPGFHTYWKNPGLVGVGTSIEWTLPDGFTASEISWPYPEKSFMGQYPCHGYERDVTLLVTITPPAQIEEKTLRISAKTIWMCCAKGCFPGYETFEISLPVTKEAQKDQSTAARFQKARSEFPTSDDRILATLVSKTDAKIIEVHFKGLQKTALEEMYFFSSDKQISSDQKQSFLRKENGTVLLSVPRSEYSPEKANSLPGVLLVGKRHLAIEAKMEKQSTEEE